MLRMLDTFAGIGGFSYAAERLVGGYETAAFVEWDKKCQQVLAKNFPGVPIYGDIREFEYDADRLGRIHIITGGYPCQPFSAAGKRRGDQDDRHLWPRLFEVVKSVRPDWFVGENVAGHITMGIDQVLSDLEAANYSCRCFVIPAVAADAPHRRDRVWIIAHANGGSEPNLSQHEQQLAQNVAHTGCQQQGAAVSRSGGQSIYCAAQEQRTEARDGFADCGEIVSNANNSGRIKQRRPIATCEEYETTKRGGFWRPEPAVGRVANGIPGRVDRLKQLGNSIVPQVAARILWAIRETYNEQT